MLDVRVTRDSVELVKRPRYIAVAVAHAPYVAVVVVIKAYRSLGRGVAACSAARIKTPHLTVSNQVGRKIFIFLIIFLL